MDRHVARALLIAWNHPEFRAALQHLIDLDEVSRLLSALADGDHDEEVSARAIDLLHSALDRGDIRAAVMVLLENVEFRTSLSAGVADAIKDRPELGPAIAAALGDPKVRADLGSALENPSLRELLWRIAEAASGGRRARAAGKLVVLLARHRTARHLVAGLRRHGVLRSLWRSPATV
jgi:hypothetical protein